MKRPLLFFRVIVMVLFVGLFTAPASAANSSGLSLTPRKDFILNPGQSTSSTLPVTNLNSKLSLTLTLRVIDFTFLNNTGTPKLIVNQNTPQTSWSLKPFITLPNTVTIGPGDSKDIPINVSVPSNQIPGGYYSAVEYVAAGTDSSSVNLNASGVSLLFLTVPGQAYQNMSLIKVGAYHTDNSSAGGHYSSFSTSAPNEIGYTLKNNGNLVESPVGSATVTPSYGKNTINISNINRNNESALIGQSRLFTTCVNNQKKVLVFDNSPVVTNYCAKPHVSIGHNNIKLDIFYGQAGDTTRELTGIASFWYVPWWFILITLGIIAVIVAGVTVLVVKIRRALNIESSEEYSEEDEDE